MHGETGVEVAGVPGHLGAEPGGSGKCGTFFRQLDLGNDQSAILG
jgi:hypothetical protein